MKDILLQILLEHARIGTAKFRLVVSGDIHLCVKDYGEFEILGRTPRDDAAGEAFDKRPGLSDLDIRVVRRLIKCQKKAILMQLIPRAHMGDTPRFQFQWCEVGGAQLSE